MNQIAFVRETTLGTVPGVTIRGSEKVTYSGMLPYYRRVDRLTGFVTVYLRDRLGRKGPRLTLEPDKAKLFERGKSYTIEES